MHNVQGRSLSHGHGSVSCPVGVVPLPSAKFARGTPFQGRGRLAGTLCAHLYTDWQGPVTFVDQQLPRYSKLLLPPELAPAPAPIPASHHSALANIGEPPTRAGICYAVPSMTDSAADPVTVTVLNCTVAFVGVVKAWQMCSLNVSLGVDGCLPVGLGSTPR